MRYLKTQLTLALLLTSLAVANATEPEGEILRQDFKIDGHPAFIIESSKELSGPRPWVLYAPTLGRGLPGGAEHWMFRQFLDAGIAIAGVDVASPMAIPRDVRPITHCTST